MVYRVIARDFHVSAARICNYKQEPRTGSVTAFKYFGIAANFSELDLIN